MRSADAGSVTATDAPSPEARVVAFYLPQYHRIVENDRWWGEGFTDWTNVRRAKSLFEGHDQPRVPTSLGYYDLGNADVHHAQAALARSFGVSAFCYYAYWFRGRRLLERPLDLVAAQTDLNMPYAICWANETWSRRWDGSENEILIEQRHSPDEDTGFVNDVAKHLADPRYVRVAGRPLLIVYRPGLLSDPLRTTDALRERATKLGLGNPFLAMVQSFGHWEPISYGFDAAIEFPPHNLGIDAVAASHRTNLVAAPANLQVRAFSDALRVCLSRPAPTFRWFRGVMTDWDNTPRRGVKGTAFVGGGPREFGAWLEAALEWTYLFRPVPERLVFINAWNEWAEGAYLEPDASHGTAYLNAVSTALRATRSLASQTSQLTAAGPDNRLLELARERWTGYRSSSEVKEPR